MSRLQNTPDRPKVKSFPFLCPPCATRYPISLFLLCLCYACLRYPFALLSAIIFESLLSLWKCLCSYHNFIDIISCDWLIRLDGSIVLGVYRTVPICCLGRGSLTFKLDFYPYSWLNRAVHNFIHNFRANKKRLFI